MTDKSGWWIELLDDSGSKEITRVSSVSPRWVRNDAGDGRHVVARDDAIHEFAKFNAEMRLWYGDPADGGSLFWRGFLHKTTPDDEDLTLTGPGIAHILDEDAPEDPVTYTNIASWEAVQDYWDTYTSVDATVYQPNPTQIVTQETVQSASTASGFDAITPSYSDTTPVRNTSTGPKLQQTCFLFEGETLSMDGSISESDASAGESEAIAFSGTSDSTSFSLNYTIPEEHVRLGVRFRTDNGSDNEIEATIDGQRIGLFGESDYPDSYVGWSFASNWSGGELTAGSHSTGWGMVSDNTGSVYIDAWAVYDDRYEPTFPTGLDNGFLAGPELYPASPTVAFTGALADFNVIKGYLDIATPDTAGIGKLQISFDEGNNWAPADGSEQNTTSVTATPSDDTRDIRGRVQLTGYGSRSSPAPTQGFKAGEVTDWDLQADGDDLSVIDEITLTNSHLENQQTLHDYWDGTFIVGHEADSIPVYSYRYGQDISAVQEPLPGRIDERNPEVNGEAYANRVDLRGAKDANGNRPRAVLQDDTAVANDPRVITLGSPPIYDLDITTEAGALFRARGLLQRAQRQGELRGDVELGLPHKALAGLQYPVDFGDGQQYLTAEEVRVEGGGRQSGTTIKFGRDSSLANEVDQLTQSKAGKDEV